MIRIELVYGHRRCDGELLSLEQVSDAAQQTLEVFSTCFAGAQAYNRLGGYLSHGLTMIEPATVIYALADEVENNHAAALWSLARDIAARLYQDSVMLVIQPIQGTVSFITPHSTYQEHLFTDAINK